MVSPERGKTRTSSCMMRPKVYGLTMTRWIPMSFKTVAIICATALALPVCEEAPKGSLANLIQEGSRKAALAQIRSGADVNEAQLDGTRPIHWAVYRVDYELLDALISKKANVEV